MENAEAPMPTLPQKWAQSVSDFFESISRLFLALSCVIFWGLKILFKSVFYGGPNKKKPWIIVLIKIAIEALRIVLERKEKKKKDK